MVMQALIDILNDLGQPTGRKTTIDEATNKGYWHLGAHAIIYTPSGSVIVQKRAHNMYFHPDMLDLSVGGFVDSHETPEQAIIREIKEELGISVTHSQLTSTGVTKYNHHWPSYRKVSRSFIYRYLVRVENEHVKIVTQASEVAWAKFISMKEVKQLLRDGEEKTLGRLEPTFAYYREILEELEKKLNSVS